MRATLALNGLNNTDLTSKKKKKTNRKIPDTI